MRLAKTTVMKWWGDNVLRLSAALSFYTILSLAPLLSIAGLMVDEQVMRTKYSASSKT